MASIKDLKNNQEVVIDATQNQTPKQQTPRSDNNTNLNGRGKTTINMNGMFEQPKGNHTNIIPKEKSQVRVQRNSNNNNNGVNIDATGNTRKSVDLSQFPSQTPEEAAYAKKHFVDDPMERLLGDDEDTIFSKYIARKEEELKDAYEQVNYNKELKELEEEAELTGDDSAVIDFMNQHGDERIQEYNEEDVELANNSSKSIVVNDDDILSSLNNNEEETLMADDKNVNENIDEEVMDEPVDVIDDEEDNIPIEDEEINYDDSDLDDEELYPEDEGYAERENIEETEKEESKEEPVKIENPDIDLEVTNVENTGTNSIIADIDLSLEDVEEEESPEPENDTDEVLKKLQKLATERLKPVSKRLDISSFTVVKKPISNTKQFNVNPVKAAKWVLMNQEATVLMREFTGAELERLREFTQDGNSVSSLTKRYRMIYDHIDSPKPASFETWLKTTPFSDEDNYFFAIYIASFKGANYLPRDCSDQNECKETWLTEDIDIMDMVKFETEEAKKKFTKIYQEEDSSTTKAGLYISERVALSENIAIAFREPSIYTRIELSSLDQEFREKYQAIMEYIPYIDSIYFINQEEGTLTPVGYKSFADNNVKTTKSKIQQFAKVLSTLSIDEFGTIRPYVNSVASRTSGMQYRYPECTCPKCGKLVEEATASAEELLFTRYQLGALVNTSLN